MDREAMAAAGCRSGLTRRDSDSFAISLNCSNDFSASIANAPPQGASTVWTDKKHRLYLSSLEASFVNELQNYIGQHGCLREIMQRPYSTRGLPADHCNPLHEVVDYDGQEPLLESTADSDISQGNLWVHHFASSDKQHTAASHDLLEHTNPCRNRIHVRMDSVVSDGLARRTEQEPTFYLFHQVVGSTTEASDQNFVDEGQGKESFYVSLPKRTRRSR